MNTTSIKFSHERPRPSPLTIEKKIIPKKILIKGKQRKEKVKYLFDSLDIPLPKENNQKDTSTDKVN